MKYIKTFEAKDDSIIYSNTFNMLGALIEKFIQYGKYNKIQPMKYIKTFEDINWNNEQLYNIGDIVKLDINKILNFNKTNGYTPVKNPSLFPAHSVGEICKYDADLPYPYSLEFYDGSIAFDTENEEILRKANIEEIKKLLFIKNLSKFNL